MENTINKNIIEIETINNVDVAMVTVDNEKIDLSILLTAIHMNLAIFNTFDIAGKQNLLKCAIDTYKANKEKEKAVKRVKAVKSIHWASKTTTEVKCVKAFIQGFKYLCGFVQNNTSLLNEYKDNENATLADIIDASIDKLLAENASNVRKGSEKVKYNASDYENAGLFISALLKDKNSNLYKWLLQSKLACYEKIVYTIKDKTDKQAENKQHN